MNLVLVLGVYHLKNGWFEKAGFLIKTISIKIILKNIACEHLRALIYARVPVFRTGTAGTGTQVQLVLHFPVEASHSVVSWNDSRIY